MGFGQAQRKKTDYYVFHSFRFDSLEKFSSAFRFFGRAYTGLPMRRSFDQLAIKLIPSAAVIAIMTHFDFRRVEIFPSVAIDIGLMFVSCLPE